MCRIILKRKKEKENSLKSTRQQERAAEMVEKRKYAVSRDIGWLQGRHSWPGIRRVVQVIRTTSCRGQKRTETSYYITSSRAGIESMHWMLDVIFMGDKKRYGSENAHITLNIFRKMSLAINKNYLAKTGKKKRLKGIMLRCMPDRNRFMEVMTQYL